MTWPIVCASHPALQQKLMPLKGQTISIAQWENLARQVLGQSTADRNHPSDHCANMNNDGGCECSETDWALVKRVANKGRFAQYLVL
jgi:hypothetical protein